MRFIGPAHLSSARTFAPQIMFFQSMGASNIMFVVWQREVL